MRKGEDEQDTHESMQVNRVEQKYESGGNEPIRHPGKQRLRHRGDNPDSIPGEPDSKINE